MRKSMIFIFMVLALIMGACSSDPKIAFEDLPEGNADDGRLIFEQKIGGSMACSQCHRLDGVDSTGPDLSDYADIAMTRVDDKTVAEYTFESIVSPGKYIVTGYNNNMERGYDKSMNAQQIADLIAYLLEQ